MSILTSNDLGESWNWCISCYKVNWYQGALGCSVACRILVDSLHSLRTCKGKVRQKGYIQIDPMHACALPSGICRYSDLWDNGIANDWEYSSIESKKSWAHQHIHLSKISIGIGTYMIKKSNRLATEHRALFHVISAGQGAVAHFGVAKLVGVCLLWRSKGRWDWSWSSWSARLLWQD